MYSVTGCVRLWDARQENVCEVLVQLQVRFSILDAFL